MHPAEDNSSYLEGVRVLLQHGADVNAIVDNEAGEEITAAPTLKIADIRGEALKVLRAAGGQSRAELAAGLGSVGAGGDSSADGGLSSNDKQKARRKRRRRRRKRKEEL